jgi:hypothetical protein
MSAPTKKTMFEVLLAIYNEYIMPTTAETLRLFPDSAILGTALLGMISLSKSYGVLLAAMLELLVTQRVLASAFGAIAPLGAGPQALDMMCQPGFVFPNKARISLIETIGKPSTFPSPVMFFMTGLAIYMIACMQDFSKEINTLGGDVKARTKIGIVLSGLFVFFLLAFRFNYGCETFPTLFISMLFGAVVGYGFYFLNKQVFGRDGLNILNLPLIRTMDERGKPMYVCAP